MCSCDMGLLSIWGKIGVVICDTAPGGVTRIFFFFFLTECVARGLKPLPISKDFSHLKNS